MGDLRGIKVNYTAALGFSMNGNLENFDDASDEEYGLMWKAKASTRALCDIIEKHNLEKEVEELYEIYAVEEKAIWEEWANKVAENRK